MLANTRAFWFVVGLLLGAVLFHQTPTTAQNATVMTGASPSGVPLVLQVDSSGNLQVIVH